VSGVEKGDLKKVLGPKGQEVRKSKARTGESGESGKEKKGPDRQGNAREWRS